ncbi:unnamed protein product [Dibothriocephalus latus]|uniref:Major facilitator superfamily (MFS) profile domain-containing protein n=1 Tax=Dibothriocephalus latus TaxID=60516 RepID=A0A3P7L2D4_DIBLA|nr:unnamed protein product [Dibothriocephalus latus]
MYIAVILFNLGLGLGAIYLCAMVSVTYYFEKYRGVTSGISAAGNGVGYIIAPLFLSTLMEYMDWRMSVLVYALIIASVFFSAGITLRPIEVDIPDPDEMADLEEKQSLLQMPVSPRSRQVSLAYADVGAVLRMLEPIQETDVESGQAAAAVVPQDPKAPVELTPAEPQKSTQEMADVLEPLPSTGVKPEAGDLPKGTPLIFSSVPVLPTVATGWKGRGNAPPQRLDPLPSSQTPGDTAKQDESTKETGARERRDSLLEHFLYKALGKREKREVECIFEDSTSAGKKRLTAETRRRSIHLTT